MKVLRYLGCGIMQLRMLIYKNWGCWFNRTEDASFTGIEAAGFIVFKMLDNGSEDADLIELMMPNYWNWGCWIIGAEDADLLVLNAGLIELRILIFWNWGCLFIGS